MSTPINQIRRNGDSQPQSGMLVGDGMNSDSQLVEDILREMGDSPGMEQQSNINSQAYQYATDQSQVPAYKYTEPPPPEPAYSNENNRVYAQQQDGIFGQMGISLSGDSIKDKAIKNIKYPALVFVICFIMSIPEFNRFIFGFLPQLLLESGQISIAGALFKGVLGMIIFAIIAFFI